MLRKKTRWHTFSGFGPTSLLYRANTASYPLNLGTKPCNDIKQQYNWRDYTINFGKISNNNFVTKIQISFNSKYCLLYLFKKNQEELTSLSSCFLNSLSSWSNMSLYFWNSSAIFKKTSFATWRFSTKMTSSHYRFKMATR